MEKSDRVRVLRLKMLRCYKAHIIIFCCIFH